MAVAEGPKQIQSVERALGILELLASYPEGLKLGRVCQSLGLNLSTGRNLMRTLEARGMVVHAGKGRPYLLGPRLHQLSRKWIDYRRRGATARDAAARLSRDIGEYVLLAELRGTYTVALVEIQSDQPLKVDFGEGVYTALHKMATGKVFLAFSPPDVRQELIEALKRLGDADLSEWVDVEHLEQELEQVRTQGYAVNLQPQLGIGSMAAPIRDAHGLVIAAMGLSAPLVRFDPARRDEVLAKLRQACQEIEGIWNG